VSYPHPVPVAEEATRFWEFVTAGELKLQRCRDCGAVRHPPRPLCASCQSTASEWVDASGRGEVWASTVIHPPTLPAFATRTPYAAVVVRLDEGVFLVSNIVNVAADAVRIGMPVELAITEVEPGLRLPLFRAR
jgi:uncharacterized OB-fold protein